MKLRRRLLISAGAAPLAASLTVAVALLQGNITPPDVALRALCASSLSILAAFLLVSLELEPRP